MTAAVRASALVCSLILVAPLTSRAEGPAGGDGLHATHAEHPAPTAEHADSTTPPLALDFTTVIGRYAPAGGAEAVVSASLLSGQYHPAPHDTVVLLVPVLYGSVHLDGQPTAQKVGLGDVSLAHIHTLELGSHLELPLELLVAAPTEVGDALTEAGRARALLDEGAAAVRGFEDDELYLPHRMSVVPKVELEAGLGRLQLSAYGKLPVLVRVGGARHGAEGTANDVALDTVFDAQATYDVWRGGGHERLALGARVITDLFLREPIEVPDDPRSALQVVLEPRLRADVGAFHARAGVLLPVGGRMGDAHAFGVRLGGGVAF